MLIIHCHNKYSAVIKHATPNTTPRAPTIRRGNQSCPKRFAEAHKILRASHSQLLDV